MKVRTVFLILMAATLAGTAYYLLSYVPKHNKAGEPVLALRDYFLTYAPTERLGEREYVLPDALPVWNTPADIRERVATLKSADEVYALSRFRVWTHVRLLDGREGWVEGDALMGAATHADEQDLLRAMKDLPAQAAGHAADLANLHIQPSRKAALVARVKANRELAIFDRRMVDRPQEVSNAGLPSVASGGAEAWYLVRTGAHAGWILGHLVQFDVPKSISAYSQDVNLVAWLVLNTVDDNGRQVPQYVVADRAGNPRCDFSHIRVLTWWKKKQTYAIAYREGDLEGYFPILITHEGSVPEFRLRLVDDQGAKIQKIYGLLETITRVLGTVKGWQSDAAPEPMVAKARKARKRPHGAKGLPHRIAARPSP
jgi:hypothetical protein